MMCLILLLFTSSVYCLDLPSYLTPCSVSDLDVSSCLIRIYEKAWPCIVTGDPDYNVENHSPLILKEAVIENDSLKIIFKPMTITNLETVKLTSAKFEMADTSTFSLKLQLTHDHSEWLGDYKMSGHLIALPMSDEGQSNITYVNGVVNYIITFKKVTGKDGCEYFEKVSSDANIHGERVYFYFSNLLQRRPQIAKVIEQVFSEGWEIIMEAFQPSIKKMMRDVIDRLVTAYMTTIPIDKLLKP